MTTRPAAWLLACSALTCLATPASAEPPADIRELTGGVPYEVNLVCHFIWDAIQQGEQEGFELSPAVIERVADEREEKGRHQASGEIATFSALRASDYEALVELAPYEALTTRQLALMRAVAQLRRDVELVPWNACGTDRLADAFLVAVAFRRVDQPGYLRHRRCPHRLEHAGRRRRQRSPRR